MSGNRIVGQVRSMRRGLKASGRLAGISCLLVGAAGTLTAQVVLSNLESNLACYYDFEHPVNGHPAWERDLGRSGTDIELVNGGPAMRINDGAFEGSGLSLQTCQVNPESKGNDDWKAGVYKPKGVPSLSPFASTTGISLMGWIKPTGTNPCSNSETAAPQDEYTAVGLFGLLSGTSDGHRVRALVEGVVVFGSLRLVALGRRIDGANSSTLVAHGDWQRLLPHDTWTHLTATFDFDQGAVALYRNGMPLDATNATAGDPWEIDGGTEPDLTSPSNPAGIKVGGSYPQNTRERNPFNGRLDDLMFFNKVLTPKEVQMQFACFASNGPPMLNFVPKGRRALNPRRGTFQSLVGMEQERLSELPSPGEWTSGPPGHP